MAYIGNTPADKFLTLAKQNFSTSATTSYTLDSSISSTQDIALFINNVRQSPVDAYTVSGTALTLTSATAGTDEMYCVYLGKTVGTVVPASNTITNAMMTDDSVGVAELSATGTASSSVFLRGDNAWATAGGDLSFGGDTFGADKTVGANDAYAFSLETSGNVAIKMDASGHVTKPLQPAFSAQNASSQDNLAIDAWTTLTFATEIFDQNADYNTSTHTFTAPITGRYLFSISTQFNNLDADAVYWQIQLKTSNREYPTLDSGNQYDADPTNLGYTFSIIADLDACDTAYIRYYQLSGTAQADLRTESYFTGALLC